MCTVFKSNVYYVYYIMFFVLYYAYYCVLCSEQRVPIPADQLYTPSLFVLCVLCVIFVLCGNLSDCVEQSVPILTEQLYYVYYAYYLYYVYFRSCGRLFCSDCCGNFSDCVEQNLPILTEQLYYVYYAYYLYYVYFRSCGRLFCSDCSEQSVPIPAEQLYTPVRVCDGCFNELSSGILKFPNYYVLLCTWIRIMIRVAKIMGGKKK